MGRREDEHGYGRGDRHGWWSAFVLTFVWCVHWTTFVGSGYRHGGVMLGYIWSDICGGMVGYWCGRRPVVGAVH